MTPEQENQLFQSIGQIQASQTAILNDLKDIKADIHQSIEKSEARQKEITDGLRLEIKASEKRQTSAVEKQELRLAKVEEKLTNQRIKVAAMGGTAGLAVSLVAFTELIKNGGL